MLATAPERTDILTISQTAQLIGSSRGCVHYHVLAGRLPAFRLGDRYVIRREDAEQLRRDRAAIATAPKATER
jgi:hypothetical protein